MVETPFEGENRGRELKLEYREGNNSCGMRNVEGGSGSSLRSELTGYRPKKLNDRGTKTQTR